MPPVGAGTPSLPSAASQFHLKAPTLSGGPQLCPQGTSSGGMWPHDRAYEMVLLMADEAHPFVSLNQLPELSGWQTFPGRGAVSWQLALSLQAKTHPQTPA